MGELSMNETTTYRWSFEEDVGTLRGGWDSGHRRVAAKAFRLRPQKAAQLLRRRGLKVSHLFWAGGFTGSDGHTYREGIDNARDALHTAALLGARI